MIKDELTGLTQSYQKSMDDLNGAIYKCIQDAGGFVNASNNNGRKPDMEALVYDKSEGYYLKYPIRALRTTEAGEVEVYLGQSGTIYTEKYLRGDRSASHWRPLRGSEILFTQTILSIVDNIDAYL